MDPVNNMPNMPTPTPAAPNPVMPPVAQAPTANPVAASTAVPANPIARPTATPVNPAAAPAMPAMPVNPVINPVINPTTQAAPVNPVFRPTGGGLVSATDPITMPTPPKAPDPVEEELKAPLRAAGPVPGSIGSAISVPSNEPTMQDDGNLTAVEPTSMQQTPSVSFNDPAMAPIESQPQAAPVPKTKKKTSKTTLTLLVVVAAMVVIALVAVLVMQLM